ncbi:VOC family protein [Streptomyces nanshensis]|uniref:Glyoxalase n=1 Tax=Streptomyces nanshensis TaxID=518642 RepID=A0A1E7L2I5_9ACTN|nr:VOC family protein [Streptomyces nanshensis]OEV10400.1 glyoxalase [Streptomyces nanshensis]
MYGRHHIRIARPSGDLAAAERFWVDGLGMDVLHRTPPPPPDGPGEPPAAGDGGNALLMAGWPDAGWHLEFAHDPRDPVTPVPTEEDLLVIYLDGPVPADLVGRLEECGGTRVTARNPYWERWGVTVEDPDGYRLVLSTRGWPGGGARAGTDTGSATDTGSGSG